MTTTITHYPADNPNRYMGERESVWFAAADAAEFMHATGHTDAPPSVVTYAEEIAMTYAQDCGDEPGTLGHQISEIGPWPPLRMALSEVRCTCGFRCTVLGRDARLVADAHDRHTNHGHAVQK